MYGSKERTVSDAARVRNKPKPQTASHCVWPQVNFVLAKCATLVSEACLGAERGRCSAAGVQGSW